MGSPPLLSIFYSFAEKSIKRFGGIRFYTYFSHQKEGCWECLPKFLQTKKKNYEKFFASLAVAIVTVCIAPQQPLRLNPV